MAEGAGYRGYVASRPILGNRTPQHVQNLVIRDYAARRGLRYLLSATEYAMPGSSMMLESVLDELDAVEGVIAYSVFMLPESSTARATIFRRIIEAGKSLHGAVEDVRIATYDDVQRVEEWFQVQRAVATPWGVKET
ncbi:LIC12192 family sporadic carbohydrate cluster protein [Roseiterribacter gracilis]|uniref:Sporadic carbohydrate cluster protein, LIC12192 family n=1 Tax=Roseiterribacter gracilis TaxID=2812848 RepID=A0A8S8XKV9_9PROT|nr:hypothetical protein TMPK1_36970 [Rhodospirillales bacterium TMPK1]